MKVPYRLLVLDDDENALAGMVELLRGSAYDVTPSTAYDEAKLLLQEGPYDLLITDVRLRGFNGLHLVMKTREHAPDIAVIIISGYDEPLLEIEAARYGAQFVRKPIRPAEFLEAVSRSLQSVRRERRWPRTPVVGGFRVLAAGRPAAVVDVSYGGLRLEIAGTDLPPFFSVELSGIGLNLEVEPVWAQALAQTGAILCGAALSSESSPAARTWREIVDRLSV
ncbi:MAG TPA: response regulator [Vicinamibacterales bacterium]|nr:response regulator [Vicinamibacterales bacterium]